MTDTLQRRRVRAQATCFVLILGLLCATTGLAAAGLFGLPGLAQARFGPPSPRLGTFEQVWLSALLLWEQDSLTRPLDENGAAQTFRIQPGESTASIIGRLWEAGLIPDPGSFRAYLQYSGLDTSLQAGEYQLSPALAPVALAQALQDATPAQVTFRVLPGWRMEEIAAALPTSGLQITPQDFLEAARLVPPDPRLAAELPAGATAEGFLLPGAYELPRDLSTLELVYRLVSAFQDSLPNQVRQGFAAQGLDLYQAVTLASIVEREAVVDDEMPLIASVYLNRLAAGMKLDADPTVQYAAGLLEDQRGWWPSPLTAADLQIDSPYNTYLYDGLPPGPIANPGLDALRAVAFPAQTPYYYFRAACDGSGRHSFAETYQQHLENACP
jgi:UPF0755 protein